MPKDLINGKISEQSIARVAEEHVHRLNRHIISEGDILYSRRGDVGRCAYATSKEAGWLCGTGCLRVTTNTNLADSMYVFYYLQQPATIGWVEKHAIGATMLNLNTSILSNIPISLPPLKTQRRIAYILSTYDNLIENNQRQIKLLEEAAQRLYREWFLDLRFPGYEDTPIVDGVPEGWRRVPVGAVIKYEIGGGWGEDTPTEKCENPAHVIRGTDLSGLTHGSFSEVPYRYHGEKNLMARTLVDGDIIFEVSGGSKTEGVARTALMRQSILDAFKSPVMCASFCKLIRTSKKEVVQYLYDTFQYLRNSGKTVEFDKRSASSIVNYRWKDFLVQQQILLPDQAILEQYNALAEKLYYTIIVCSKQIETAKKARDRLLPKLMSGEMEV